MWEEVEDALFDRKEIGTFVALFCNKGANDFEGKPRHYLPVQTTNRHHIQTNIRNPNLRPILPNAYTTSLD